MDSETIAATWLKLISIESLHLASLHAVHYLAAVGSPVYAMSIIFYRSRNRSALVLRGVHDAMIVTIWFDTFDSSRFAFNIFI